MSSCGQANPGGYLTPPPGLARVRPYRGSQRFRGKAISGFPAPLILKAQALACEKIVRALLRSAMAGCAEPNGLALLGAVKVLAGATSR